MSTENFQGTITAILPMRAGSQRVLKKNMRPFAGIEFGLAELKLRQLIDVHSIDEILVDTDEPRIRELIEKLFKDSSLHVDCLSKIRVEVRDPEFASNIATTDSLICYLGKKLKTDHAMWTHVTSPFLDAKTYEKAICAYRSLLMPEHDSLVSVTKLQEFIWSEGGPVNYDYSKQKWPRTQTLPDWYFINSGIFLCPSDFYTAKFNRLGDRPFLFEVDKVVGFDVDCPEDFFIAEALHTHQLDH